MRGERFVQEDHPSIGHRERALVRQPGHWFWAVFDHKILEQAPAIAHNWLRGKVLEAFNKHPMFIRVSFISELGVKSGIHPANLETSINKYNSTIEKQEPDQFNRGYRPLTISRPPFYAIQSQRWTLLSFAGLVVNKNLQVINAQNEPVGNLYAGGEVLGAGATSGNSYTNGAMVTPALTFGRLLGQKIIQF